MMNLGPPISSDEKILNSFIENRLDLQELRRQFYKDTWKALYALRNEVESREAKKNGVEPKDMANALMQSAMTHTPLNPNMSNILIISEKEAEDEVDKFLPSVAAVNKKVREDFADFRKEVDKLQIKPGDPATAFAGRVTELEAALAQKIASDYSAGINQIVPKIEAETEALRNNDPATAKPAPTPAIPPPGAKKDPPALPSAR